MKAFQILRAAQNNIATPEQWCQYHFARTAMGDICVAADSQAVAFCSLGALHNIAPISVFSNYTLVDPIADIALNILADAIGVVSSYIHHWNDKPGRTHAEVWQAFDRAIYMAEQAGV